MYKKNYNKTHSTDKRFLFDIYILSIPNDNTIMISPAYIFYQSVVVATGLLSWPLHVHQFYYFYVWIEYSFEIIPNDYELMPEYSNPWFLFKDFYLTYTLSMPNDNTIMISPTYIFVSYLSTLLDYQSDPSRGSSCCYISCYHLNLKYLFFLFIDKIHDRISTMLSFFMFIQLNFCNYTFYYIDFF